MKSKIKSFIRRSQTAATIIGVVVLCVSASLRLNAQTNPPPALGTNAGTFFDTTIGYFSSFNTNLVDTFANRTLEIWTGAEQNGGNTTAADLGVELNLWSPATNVSVSLDMVAKNAGIGGTLVGAQGGVGLTFTHVDAQLTGYVDGGYDNVLAQPYCEIGARVKKALTDNTYAGVGVSLDLEKRFQGRPNLVLFTGFTF